MLKTTLILMFILLTCACQSVPKNAGSKPPRNQPSLTGFWQSKGYGYILEINTKKRKLYDFSSNHCIEKDLSQREISAYLTDLKQVDVQTIQAKIQSGVTDYYLNKIDQLPQLCKEKHKGSHLESVRYFVDVMNDYYAYFDLYDVDWEKRTNGITPLLNDNLSAWQAFKVVTDLLTGITDAHIYISAEIDDQPQVFTPGRSKKLRPALDKAFVAQEAVSDGRTFRRAWFSEHKNNIEEHVLGGQFKYHANDKILWGKIGGVGYINLLRMMDLTKSGSVGADLKVFKNNMDTIMAEVIDTEALIIDVSTNSGGHDEVGLAMAGYFTEFRTHAYSKRAHRSGAKEQQIFINPNSIYYDKPVYVFTSDHTVSAAETFVMAMKNLPQVTQVGDTTRGAFSDVLDKTLPNGWEVGFSNEVYRDQSGQSWEAKGLQPQWLLPVFEGSDIFQSHLIALGQLLTRIGSVVVDCIHPSQEWCH